MEERRGTNRPSMSANNKRAYPAEMQEETERHICAIRQENGRVQSVLRLALLCILATVSFTRKDGQHLRCNYRFGRAQGKMMFDKGVIPGFDQTICHKIHEILADASHVWQTSLFPVHGRRGKIQLHEGSRLQILPELPDSAYDAIITSPPYCNCYDYTRTYAMQLAALGVSGQGIAQLRREMLSCTVENQAKDLSSFRHK